MTEMIARDTARIAMDWLLNSGDTGLSSEAIARHMLGLESHGRRPWAYPLDPADMGRCLRLLELIPEWMPRLHEMASYCPEWAALIARWDEIAASMRDEVGIDWSKGRRAERTYNLMKDILGAARAALARTGEG